MRGVPVQGLVAEAATWFNLIINSVGERLHFCLVDFSW
jgi:hypothetical protein